MKPRWIALPFGFAFGFLLSWGRMTDPEVIRAMLLFREWDIYLLMGSAMAVAMIGAHLLHAAKANSFVGGEPIAWTRTWPTRNHVIGSVLFGFGWSIACTCPGPIAAQLGMGRFGAFLIVGGMLGGISLRGWQQSRSAKPLAGSASIAATAGL
jgi:uncharacterized membrane protein YedE/YeeE